MMVGILTGRIHIVCGGHFDWQDAYSMTVGILTGRMHTV